MAGGRTWNTHLWLDDNYHREVTQLVHEHAYVETLAWEIRRLALDHANPSVRVWFVDWRKIAESWQMREFGTI